jgi:hypothetical protein
MNVGKSPKDVEMSDCAFSDDLFRSDGDIAADLIRKIAGRHYGAIKRKTILETVYSELRKVNKEWTRRRVRALADKEAARIDHREIREMQRVLALQEARRVHAEQDAEDARHELRAARLAATGEAGNQVEMVRESPALRSLAGVVDQSRAGGAQQ